MNLELPTLVQPNGYRMDIDAAMMWLSEIRSQIGLALPDDVALSIMQRLHAENRYGDVEQAWIDEAVATYPDARTQTGHTVAEMVDVFERERSRVVAQFGHVVKPAWYD